MAQVEEPPAAAETEVAVEIPLTTTGVLEDPVDPIPNCPDPPQPQHLMVLSIRVTQVCAPPAETEVTSVMLTDTGNEEPTEEP